MVTRVNAKQRALAAEVRAEMGRQNIKAAPIQRALGISSTAWGTYFVQCTRDVPISVVQAVAEYLGLTGSELLRRAEASTTTKLEAYLSPAARQVAEEQREKHLREHQPGADAEDPPDGRTEGRHSA